MIYLDNAATTKVSKATAQLVYDYATEYFANPSSIYEAGMKSEELIADARKKVAAALNVADKCIYFTSGGTESIILGLQGLFFARREWCKNFVTTAYEHSAVHKTLQFLADEFNIEMRYVNPEPSGTIDSEKLLSLVDGNTGLVAVMHVNNETGAICDVGDLSTKVKAKNRKTGFFSDGVQGFLKVGTQLSGSCVDGYSISGHKFGAPKGIGALYLKDLNNYKPVSLGGGQESGVRAGTQNTPYIATLGDVVQRLFESSAQRHAEISAMRDRVAEVLTGAGAVVNSPEGASPYLLNVSFVGAKSAVMQRALDREGILVSSGSSCSKGQNSKTLTAMGLDTKRIEGALRISFFEGNTMSECETAARIIAEVANKYSGLR